VHNSTTAFQSTWYKNFLTHIRFVTIPCKKSQTQK